MTSSEWRNKLYYGDNLVWLRDRDKFPSECVDLIYLDPPFNSNADYNVIFNEPGGESSQAQIRAFVDTWHWDRQASEEALRNLGGPDGKPELIEFIHWIANRGGKAFTSTAAYLSMMAVRLVELHRVLKATGSLYLHCDPTMSHYIKLVMDQIFGPVNFRNEIVWDYGARGTVRRRGFPRRHHILLYYTKSENFVRNPVYRPYKDPALKRYNKVDEQGRRYALIKRIRSATGEVYYGRTYPGDEGAPVTDVWDIPLPAATSKEWLGYQTQKPLALLKRIISASSNEGDLVLDPFCGCGTTTVAAHNLNRRWIGIDVTWLAIEKIENRLLGSFNKSVKATYEIEGNPSDVSSALALWERDKREFEIWALSLVGAAQREWDGGVDGLLSIIEGKGKDSKVIVQVKGGRGLNPGMVRDLIGTVEKEGAAIGLFVTLNEPTSGMKELATHAGPYTSPISGKSYPRIQIRTVGDLLKGIAFDLPPYGQSPMKKATPIKKQERPQQLL